MRTLLLMRGAPGAGKTTWIKQHHLENYTLSSDSIRALCSSLELQPTGEFKISQERDNEAMTWDVLFKILEHRMSRGEFTVIDATCSKTKDIKQYKDLADSYRYRMYIVDFTDIPLDVCLKQNLMRPSEKHVPENSIKNIYARFATQKVPSGVTVIKRDEFDTLLEEPFDLSEYKKIVFIGDIHGCYDTLMQYPDFKDGLKDDTEYIFCGDYVDRGNQNAEVLRWLNSICQFPNVCLLEGNHERWIRDFGKNVPAKSKEFEFKTKPELYRKGFTEKEARMLYRKFRQCSHFTYNGIEVLACHGGIPNLNTNLLYLPADAFVHGIGTYSDYKVIAESWIGQTKPNQYLIHGHRNIEDDEIQIADRVFNLEGRVEFGGNLRIVELSFDGKEHIWNTVELTDIQPVNKDLNTEYRTIDSVEKAIEYLRNNKCVQEKKLDERISSFNFTRDAFYKGNWNNQTVLARGLFIDTKNKYILARSYEKFFKINEVPQTELAALKDRFVFPVTAYLKENGFLAIVSYDKEKDELFIASKSTNNGDYVNYIKKQINPHYLVIKNFLKEHSDLSLVFECEDIENDPHIIKYEKDNIVLLDAIYNTLNFNKVCYDTLQQIGNIIGCDVKQKCFEFNNWDEFTSFYRKLQKYDFQYNDKYVEGFVFEDSNLFMTKCKTAYYDQWKKLRGVAQQTLKSGYIIRTGMLNSSLENLFYGFCRELHEKYYDKETKSYSFKTDIISLREKFLEEKDYILKLM